MLALAALFLGCSPPTAPTTPSHTISTSDPDAIQFVVVGDIGKPGARHASVAKAVSDVCTAKGCDLVVFTGDNVYPRGAQAADDPVMQQVFAPYLALDIPIMAVLGNHDWGHGFDNDAATAQLAFAEQHPNLLMPAPDHVVRAGPATFIGVDTTRVFWGGQSWRTQWLQDSFLQSQTPLNILVGHHPYHSDGPHGNAGQYEGWRNIPWMSGTSVKRMLDRVVCAHTDLYLSGHDHSLQHLQACGRDLIVSGAGASTTALKPNGSRLWGSESLGFAWVHMEAGLALRFYDLHGKVLHTYER